jgi:hypothetical protein
MHVSSDAGGADRLSDPGREAVWGGEYGPYVVSSYTRPLDHRRAAIYFVMSTWNPYNTVLMTAALERAADPGGGREQSWRPQRQGGRPPLRGHAAHRVA